MSPTYSSKIEELFFQTFFKIVLDSPEKAAFILKKKLEPKAFLEKLKTLPKEGLNDSAKEVCDRDSSQ